MSRTFGPYNLLEKLGHGGSGQVFRARREPSLEFVALKILDPALAKSATARMQLAREAEVTLTLDHPNLVRGVDAGQVDHQPYLATELMEGGSLARFLDRARRRKVDVPVDVGVFVVEQVLRGLRALHEARGKGGARLRFVHRDVCPNNVFFSVGGRVCLGDLGLAAVHTLPTDPGTRVGRLAYAAPELLETTAVDVRADLFSVAVVLYEILCGRLPFAGDTVEARAKALARRPERLQRYRPEISAGLEQVVMAALRPNPSDRPPDASTMLAALEGHWSRRSGHARRLASLIAQTFEARRRDLPREQAVAFHKLTALGIKAFVADGRVFGKLRVEPKRFERIESVDVGPEHTVVVRDNAVLTFVGDSPLRHLGPIRFLSARSPAHLEMYLAAGWRGLAEQTASLVEHARRYLPTAVLDPDDLRVTARVENRVIHFDRDHRTVEVSGGAAPRRHLLPEDPTAFDLLALDPPSGAPTRPMPPPSIGVTGDLSLDLHLDDPDPVQVPEPAVPEEPAPVLVGRAPRVPTARSAQLEWEDRLVHVVVEDASRGGVFVAMPLKGGPVVGQTVSLGGVGPVSVEAEVAHRRSAAEAALLGRSEGVGLCFQKARARLEGEISAVLVAMPPSAVRMRVLELLAESFILPIVVHDVVTALVSLLWADIRLVVMDGGFAEGRWWPALEALGIRQALLVGSIPADLPSPPGTSLEAVSPDEVETKLDRAVSGLDRGSW